MHVVYARPPGAPDRFAALAPRIVGDVVAFDAWWRREDPARAPRFDLFPLPLGCASPFGALDISAVQLPRSVGGITTAFQEIRLQLASETGLAQTEKAYLVYFDGPTGQSGTDHVCGQGARAGGFGLPGLAGFWGEFPAILSAFSPAQGLNQGLFRGYMVVASVGTVFAAGYLLWMYQRTAFGTPTEEFEHAHIHDMHLPEYLAWVPMLVLIVVLGILPGVIFRMTDGPVQVVSAAFKAIGG